VTRAALLYIPIEPSPKQFFGFNEPEKVEIDQKPHIWILEDGKPKKIYVKVLGYSGSDTAIASDELKEGDPVIVTQEKRP